MKKTWKNFKEYSKYGTVPTLSISSHKNSFYQSVHYIYSILGPIKDLVCGVEYSNGAIGSREERMCGILPLSILLPTCMILSSTFLAFAYLSYLPAKGISKLLNCKENPGKNARSLKENTESLVNYANNLLHKAREYSDKIAEFCKIVVSYALSAVIWLVALVVTPLVWAGNKISTALSSASAEPLLDEERSKPV
ncbi:hypothetical protein [Wolbachia endosymbiont of Pentidionis agamae]|uniref:hypothetical protein n=1 Tax=Wolbachia endosymbiont of Pentidionis agamae TaxID=3110435 RepID=UPI002FD1D1E9